jgi:peptide-methionine (S)-S-oxide reductase
MEAVFCGDARQEEAARARGITAPIVTGAPFHLAEDYHQKYYLRRDQTLLRELADYTPQQLVDSTVAARLNGFLAGKGSVARLREEDLGLSPAGATYLERLVRQRES